MHLGHVGPVSGDARAARPACRASSTTSTAGSAPTTMWCSSSPTARPSPITMPAASASWIWCRAPRSRPRKHFAGMGIEPLGNELSGETIARLFQRQAHAPEGRPSRPAPDRGARQYLCVRGAVPHRPSPGSAGRLARDRRRASRPRRRTGSPTSSGTCSTRRSRPAARPCATMPRWTARSAISSTLPGLRPGGRGLRDARLHRHGDPPRAVRPLYLLLPGLPEAGNPGADRQNTHCHLFGRQGSSAGFSLAGRSRPRLPVSHPAMRRGDGMAFRDDSRRDARQGGADHPQPAPGPERPQFGAR